MKKSLVISAWTPDPPLKVLAQLAQFKIVRRDLEQFASATVPQKLKTALVITANAIPQDIRIALEDE
ncbi:hypothetical protein GWE18_40425 [Bradyrhizobium sp. CSA112]|uniref:hypothetical protein n=1 Tax=Bradyrhizobium sp. CSA112 TaxID=2699170 RepID=UPI0023B06FF3|nr:hypothetical protein [Bradyrhizobium sp. CSA112]MDE5458892.1 hypothetical protein [Bradyrhizobium sp. CSA112]